MLKAKDLVNQSLEELESNYTEAVQNLFALVNTLKMTKKSDKPHEISDRKRDIARLLTVINQKKQSK